MRKKNGKELPRNADPGDMPVRNVECKDLPDRATHDVRMAASTADAETVALLNADLRRVNADLKESRAKLKASEARLRTVLESATEYAIITTDLQGHISGWNAGAYNILGWSEEEVIGRDLGLLFTPEDRALGIPEREMQTARQAGRAEDERWHLRKDGRHFWGRGMVTPLGDSGAQGFLKILRDRTEERAAAEAVQAANRRATDILESISDAFVALDRDYRITYQNRQSERIKGIPTPAVLGKTAWEAWPTSVGTPVEAAVRRAMEAQVPVELQHRYQDDQVDAWLEFNIHPTSAGLCTF
ncbi:PAS domain-containing protein [Azospirillum canadense]|uniref:PAS domain-containing protein n=1 Tax=Azospirillum canadense TaxID=403962 RepID=UPI00222628C3|nr:PAS domain S-box protein [Azospirillum canadense]MCW2241844.1 PAS domain S-box-containing protein [Azospirillum canadense]